MRTPVPWLIVLGSLVMVACDSKSTLISPSSPTPSPTPGPATLIFLKGITISGNFSLPAIGQTSQLTGTAVFSDGTTKEVTKDTPWVSDDPSVATISSGGLLTGMRFGKTWIRMSDHCCNYVGEFANAVAVTVTPPGTFAVMGDVREPGHGPLSDVQVAETLSRQTTMTRPSGQGSQGNPQGQFSLGGLTSGAHLRFSRDGYEPVETDLKPLEPDPPGYGFYPSVPMQRIVRLRAGQAISPEPLHNNDVAYTMPGGQLCRPCRLIHVDVPSSGTLRLQLKWVTGALDLELWVGGQRFLRSNVKAAEVDTEMPVSAGEIVVYVESEYTGATEQPMSGLSFTLASSLTQYAANMFPEPGLVGLERGILSFQICIYSSSACFDRAKSYASYAPWQSSSRSARPSRAGSQRSDAAQSSMVLPRARPEARPACHSLRC